MVAYGKINTRLSPVGGCVCTKWLPLQMQCMLVDTSSVKLDVRRIEIMTNLIPNRVCQIMDNA